MDQSKAELLATLNTLNERGIRGLAHLMIDTLPVHCVHELLMRQRKSVRKLLLVVFDKAMRSRHGLESR